MSIQAIQVKKLYDGSMEQPMELAIVVFENGKILDVLPPQDAAKVREVYNTDIEDCTDRYMTPGLVDSHVHLHCPGNSRDEDTSGRMTPGQEQLLAMQNAQTALRSGVTALFDCGSENDISWNVRQYINDGYVTGPDIFICGGAIMATAGHGKSDENVRDGALALRRRVRELQCKNVDFIKVMGTTRTGRDESLATFGYREDEFRAVFEEAHRLHLKTTIHATYTDIIRHVIDCGVDCVEHCNFFDQTWTKVIKDKALAEYICEKGVMASHTIGVNFGYLELLDRKPRELWTEQEQRNYAADRDLCDRILESFNFQMEQGIKAIASTDSGFLCSHFSYAMSLSMENMEKGGMPALEVIHAATGRPAAHYEIDDRLGFVRPGLQADLLLLKEDPCVNMRAFRDIDRIYKKGVLVK